MNHLLNAVHKCHQPFRSMWCGYLTPKEILALNGIGVVCSRKDIDVAVYWKRKGISNCRWFYFTPNEKFEEMKGKKTLWQPKK